MSETAPAAQQLDVLLVDDDPVFTQVLGRALTARGFTVRCAGSLDEASGLLGDAQGYAPGSIVVLTGYASISTAVDAIKLGAQQYLAKPVDVDAIVKALLGEQEPDDETAPEETLSVSRLEWEHIQRVLADNDGNISATARALKMHRRTLQRKLAKRPAKE